MQRRLSRLTSYSQPGADNRKAYPGAVATSCLLSDHGTEDSIDILADKGIG